MKQNEMIEGNWYYVQTLYPWYIKFKRFSEDGNMHSYYNINYNTKEYNEDGEYSTGPRDIRLINLSEIQQYLPDNHPDKITSIIIDDLEPLKKLLNNIQNV